jgi:hypothetical protein
MKRASRRRAESGSFLVVIMVAVAISSIALGTVAQSWSVRLRRDKEEELIFRAQQYVKAILAYRKEHAGQFPTNLEDLYKPGPRQLRYIRRLYKDPLAKDGRWGLLYLVPGGRAVIDVVVAQQAQQEKASQWGGEWETAGDPTNPAGQPGGAPGGGLQKGYIPIGGNMVGGGPAGAGGVPVAAPQVPITLPPIPKIEPSELDEDAVSEQPIGWPIVGVVSRAGGGGASAGGAGQGDAGGPVGGVKENPADRTYKVYKGHDDISEWHFHVFDFGAELPQAPAAGGPQEPNLGGPIGPGHGGKGTFRLGPGGPQPGRYGVPGSGNYKGEGNWRQGDRKGGRNQVDPSGNRNNQQDQGQDPDDD